MKPIDVKVVSYNKKYNLRPDRNSSNHAVLIKVSIIFNKTKKPKYDKTKNVALNNGIHYHVIEKTSLKTFWFLVYGNNRSNSIIKRAAETITINDHFSVLMDN